jgi:hypothetical protein
MQTVDLPRAVLTGGPDSYRRCQEEASSLRRLGVTGLIARSAALVEGGARGCAWRATSRSPTRPRDGRVVVLFGTADAFVGWSAASDARPSADLLPRVHHYKSA